MIISEIQLQIIRKLLSKSISSNELYKDLLDHLCCATESQMENGVEFDEALRRVLRELAPQGLAAIQIETTLLLNFNKIMTMKKLLYTIGLLSAMSFVTGWMFTLLHFPGATLLSLLGFCAFAIIFLPLMAKENFRYQKSPLEKLKYTLGISSAVLVAIASVMKVLQLQGGVLILVLGVSIFVLGFLPFVFLTMYRKSVASA